MDIFKRAWNLLEPGERPERLMPYDLVPGVFVERDCAISAMATYDRLCQAVEGVNLSLGLALEGDYEWVRLVMCDEYEFERQVVASDPDRLTSACNALEAERGGA